MSKLAKIRHDYLRYANVWEDAAVLITGLKPAPGERHLSIASGGDNALMLLTTDPEIVVAVDVNLPQIHLCELKRAAIRAFDRDQYLAFAGFTPSADRLKLFGIIENQLSPEARTFWQTNKDLLKRGLIQCGKFERYFRLFSNWILPLIHSRKTVKALLAPKSGEAQRAFYDRHWNTWRWKLLFKVFFSRFVMGRAGRDPAFFDEVQVPVGEHIFNKAEAQLCSEEAQRNHILHFNLTGAFGRDLPDYVRAENYDRIRANIDRLQLHHGFAESALEKWGKFDCFNLSNIFEYMDAATFEIVATPLLKGANPGARFAYWNLMVPRNMTDLFPDKLTFEKDISGQVAPIDRGFFYNRFIVNTLKS